MKSIRNRLALAAALFILTACASSTVQVTELTPATKKLAQVCVASLHIPNQIPVLVTEVNPVGNRVSSPVVNMAHGRVHDAAKLYAKEYPTELIRELKSKGVDAVACASERDVVRDRLSATVARATMSSGARGQRTDIVIRVSLLPAGAATPAWIAEFDTGSTLPSTSGPDIKSVKAFAANVRSELVASGWVKW